MATWLLHSLQGADREKFTGEVLTDYPRFLADYHHAVARIAHRPGLCLRVLRTLVAGSAERIITHHLLDDEDPATSLREALATLHMAYGASFKQSRAQVKALLDRPKVLATEKGLMEFYSELDRCTKVLAKCGRSDDLNGSETIARLLDKLPEYLQNKWEKAVELKPDRKATIQSLMEVILKEHGQKSGEINHLREYNRTRRVQDRKPDRSRPIKVNAIHPRPLAP